MNRFPFKLDSLQKQIIVFFVLFLLLIQLAGFFAVKYVIHQTAHENLQKELQVGGRVIYELWSRKTRDLVEATRVMAADYALREAIVTNDPETIVSAFRNHGARINADFMEYIRLDGTISAATYSGSENHQFAFPELIAKAITEGNASGIRLHRGRLTQVVVLPIMAPTTVGWLAASFYIDDANAEQYKRILALDTSFLSLDKDGKVGIYASNLPKAASARTAPLLTNLLRSGKSETIKIDTQHFEVLAIPFESHADLTFYAVLQRSMEEGLLPFESLLYGLFVLFLMSLFITILGGNFIARRIAQPVSALVSAAGRIAKGDYSEALGIRRNDEIGKLANAFNDLSKGLEERDRVQDLLGKVTSPAIAKQLLKQEINLGGEERVVTILFADIRNFTTLCEILTPKESLELLNRYLAVMNTVIEKHGGVVDKYTGDGVMALFGAPVSQDDDALQALLAALEMKDKLDALTKRLALENLPDPDVGIGINTARVIAGNIGSHSRLNYTVLGDGVNLAARFEGLTKRYGVKIVVGETTYEAVPTIEYRELDKVRAKGKTVPVRIFEPLGLKGQLAPNASELLMQYHEALREFRDQQWDKARQKFAKLADHQNYARICSIYIGYIEQLSTDKSLAEWDGAFTLYEK